MRRLTAVLVLVGLVSLPAGCAGAREPYRESRPVLGTAVSVTIHGGADERAGLAGTAFARMSDVERSLSPYDPRSSIAAVNADPYSPHALSAAAVTVLRAAHALGVAPTTSTPGAFSPALWGVTSLYGFGTSETVPSTQALAAAVRDSRAVLFDGDSVLFQRPPSGSAAAPHSPGVDLGGAAKGLALDAGAAALTSTRGTLITAGSSTLALGAKPDGSDWSVGVEDPRADGRVIAVVTAAGRPAGRRALSVSTSGDYQVYFQRGGVRYHHILDPATGRPAPGLRSLTVFGTMSGLDADILSTALFVMGRDGAFAYARAHDVGLVTVGEDGELASFVPTATAGISLERRARPRP